MGVFRWVLLDRLYVYLLRRLQLKDFDLLGAFRDPHTFSAVCARRCILLFEWMISDRLWVKCSHTIHTQLIHNPWFYFTCTKNLTHIGGFVKQRETIDGDTFVPCFCKWMISDRFCVC